MTASHHGSIKFWDFEKLACRHIVDTVSKLYDVDIDSHDETLAAGLQDGVKVFDLREREMVADLSGIHAFPVNCVRYSQDRT